MHSIPTVTVCTTLLQVTLFTLSNTNTILHLQYEHTSLIQIWRLFTYMFVELDPRNLILNLPPQLLLGFLLEHFHNWWKVVLLYLGGGVMAALGSSFLNKTTALVGSSPGVFSFGFSCLADTQICSNGKGKYKQLKLVAIFYLLASEAYRGLMGFLNGTTLAVHSFGAIGGYLLGSALFTSNLDNGEATQQNTYRVVGALYYVFFLIVLLILNVFFI